MRYVFAIATLALAAVLILLGIGQRTFLSGPSAIRVSTELSADSQYALLPADVLAENVGRQTVTVRGEKNVYLAYARTADVQAWLTAVPHDVLSIDQKTGELSSVSVKADEDAYRKLVVSGDSEPSDTTATKTPAEGDAMETSQLALPKNPDPKGSDLWLAEYSEDNLLTQAMDLPEGISVIVAARNGDKVLDGVSLSWSVDKSTPLAGPLLVGGIILGIVGLFLYLLAVDHDRRSTRPRRGNTKRLAGLRRQSALTGVSPKSIEKDRRRALGGGRTKLLAIPVVLSVALMASGCSADYWPKFGNEPVAPGSTAAATASAEDQDALPPAVTSPQLTRILTDASDVATTADTELDAEMAKTRFAGAALDERLANYTIRAKSPDTKAPGALSSTVMDYELPQSTKTWPRTIFTVVEDGTDSENPPLGVVLIQKSPHDNYMIHYAVEISGGSVLPDAAPAYIGTSRLAPDFNALKLQPKNIATAYADVLNNGADSNYYDYFDVTDDNLVSQVGQSWRQSERQGFAANDQEGEASFSTVPGDGEVVALSTAQQGALVAVSVLDTETIVPTNERAEITFSGSAAAALAGTNKSNTGLYQTWEYQLLFSVPGADSKDKIKLLGFTHSLVKAGAN
ncbi:hypothetical protein GCM10022198_18950 [Klugiella xanthotipulae]|uniref:DUF8094 domain-containing protein n=1 Tax=Klugiella xanthotipulae TaxID=244735 RepID=A0A543HRX7_9MICO|nr:hypothetical protein [Klugiella xanthotipulae]TQM61095.1 hypothetical protein FB466_2024 [Klugiella xanthotipulae]